ncbi:hypothetical protein [Streptomyces sp. NRRL F-2664]|uniref:hypothetical protein n=1 Tax=Streptomyces sp. NRRL F-2664 TaxID=1463842 RepID=UPI000A5AFB0F|nr:hypothetical protein [Streptomyces sp. NRRL F-2664]
MTPSFRFPDDLVALQEAWLRTYDELAQVAGDGSTTPLRRRLIALSGRLQTHPHWAAPAGWRAGGVELRRAASMKHCAETHQDSVRAKDPAEARPCGPTRAMVGGETADSAKGVERCIRGASERSWPRPR